MHRIILVKVVYQNFILSLCNIILKTPNTPTIPGNFRKLCKKFPDVHPHSHPHPTGMGSGYNCQECPYSRGSLMQMQRRHMLLCRLHQLNVALYGEDDESDFWCVTLCMYIYCITPLLCMTIIFYMTSCQVGNWHATYACVYAYLQCAFIKYKLMHWELNLDVGGLFDDPST